MMKRIAVAAIAGILIVGSAGVSHATGPGEAVGFAEGWTTFTPNSCAINPGNRFVIYAGIAGEKYLATRNPVWIAQTTPFCSDGRKFAAHVTNGVWDAISYSIRLNR